MGQEIQHANFKKSDLEHFNERLLEETQLLRTWFKQSCFEKNANRAGFELEGWIVDKDLNPANCAQDLLNKIKDPQIVPELSLFNFEYNSSPHEVTSNLLQLFSQELESVFNCASKKAKSLDCDIATIGILPTLKKSMLVRDNFHPNKRYAALDKQLKKMRHGEPLVVDIDGKESLHITHKNILLETVSTSLQIHLQMQASKAIRYYNAGFIIAAPLVAVASNSPYLFGKALWEETRIPVFEQTVNIPHVNNPHHLKLDRVSFGSGYVSDSMLELYEENLNYAVILPELMDKPKQCLSHLRLHNGTIWRWNRPLIDINKQGVPHIRLEHRVMASGTSVCDIIANIAFFLGLIRYYAYTKVAPENLIKFTTAKRNFYKASQKGLDAKVDWIDKKNVSLRTLLLECLIPQAKIGLQKLDIPNNEIDFYLKDIIKARVESGQTGANWQQQFINTHGHDFQEMMYQYHRQQQSNEPVHRWSI